MKRVLAIDFGEKRIGMALTDELQISLNPLPTVDRGDFHEKLEKLIESWEISDIVFGISHHADGVLTKVGKIVTDKIRTLEKKYSEIHFHTIDEAYSSQRARKLMIEIGSKRKHRETKGKIDQMSAIIILKDFLETI